MTNLGPEAEQTPLGFLENVRFELLVEEETYAEVRNLLSYWAVPGDLDKNGNASHALNLTLAALWREPIDETEEIND